MKKSNLYDHVVKMIDGEEIDDFNLGISSKSVLHQIKKYSDEDIEFQHKLLKSYKINISTAKRMILDKQSKERQQTLMMEIAETTTIDKIIKKDDRVEIIHRLLKLMTNEDRSNIYVKLQKMVVSDRPKYILTAEQKKNILERTEELYKNAKGNIPKYIFGHRRYHKEYNDNTWTT